MEFLLYYFPTITRWIIRHPIASTAFTALAILFASWIGWLYPTGMVVLSALVSAIALIVGAFSMNSIIIVVLFETMVGSFGRWIILPVGARSLSIREVFFLCLIVSAVIRLKDARYRKALYKLRATWVHHPLLIVSALLIVLSSYGAIRGLFLGNDPVRLFDDSNQWVFAILGILLVWETMVCPRLQRTIAMLWIASIAVLSALSLVFLYIFTHDEQLAIASMVFRWSRDARLAEITLLSSSFARVFLQSQIVVIPVLLALLWKSSERALMYYERLVLAAVSVIIVLSFSRSFWVGIIVGGGVMILAVFCSKRGIRSIGKIMRSGVVALAAALLIIIAVAKFPFPQASTASLARAFEERVSLENDSAVGSRWNLLPQLWEGVRRGPFLGSGLGATITYKSRDPRVLLEHPSGIITTHAFEWGILDFWYKFGIFGLIALFILALVAVYWISQGLAVVGASVFSLIAIHAFTPYLNHPIGFVYLFLILLAVEQGKDLPAFLSRRASKSVQVHEHN